RTAASTCPRGPNPRRYRDPSGLGANRRGIWDRYLPPGSPSCPRVLIGMTEDRMPSSSRAYSWWVSVSNAASASTRSHPTARDAWARTGRNCGESLDGPVVTVAPARKCEAVSTAAVSLVQEACSAPDRRAKYLDV